MIHGEVVGELWSTIKVSSLDGHKLLVVRPAGGDALHVPDVVAVDLVSAGVGDRVVVALGKAARHAIGRENVACEAAIIGVVDDTTVEPSATRGAKTAAAKKKKTSRKKSKRKDEKPADETLSLPGFEDADAIWSDEDEG